MPESPLVQLKKILDTEASRGYDNRGIFGGLDKYATHWQKAAQKATIESDVIAEIVSWLKAYPALTIAGRTSEISEIQTRLDALVNAPAPQAAPAQPARPAPQKAPTVSKQKAQKPPEKQPAPQKKTTPKQKSERSISGKPDPLSQVAPRAPLPPMPDGLQLNSPMTILAGVGPKQSENLAKIGINSIYDALYTFPRRYIDYSALKPISQLRFGEEVTVIGTIQSVNLRPTRNPKHKILEAVLGDGTGTIRLSWFNQQWLKNSLKPQTQVQISGKVDQYLGRLVFNSPEWEPLEANALSTGRIVPVYGLTAGLSSKNMRKWMHNAVGYGASRVEDPLPAALRKRLKLLNTNDALVGLHFPDSQEELAQARRRIAFEELLLMQLGFQRQKADWQSQTGLALPSTDGWMETALATLPFSLTNAQSRVLKEIRNNISADKPMNRLVQGDVGSGKTAVAALAMAVAVQNGAQAALMAPTSILAEQHYSGIRKLIGKVPGIDWGDENQSAVRLLQGATPAKERREILAGLLDGSVKVLIGTHAVIQDTVEFTNLGLAVIDEQHRFGVGQRAALRSKGANPHLLVMTATPIPRSLALTVYGDLDVSVIDEMPPGRQPIQTRVVYPQERERCYQFIRSQVEKGRQAYIICPLVEDTGKVVAKAAVDEHKRLSSKVFPDLKLSLLHGRMKPSEKDAIMDEFRNGETQILVSTSVIEVGVDVPNSTIMLIEGSNRFGLAQLHQFRGRVGRGEHKSFCLLMTESTNGQPVTQEDVSERLKVMESTTDGFVLAEKDLEIRGPGDFMGTRQAGYQELHMAQLSDLAMIGSARDEANKLFKSDPNLEKPVHALLKARLAAFWQPGAGDIS